MNLKYLAEAVSIYKIVASLIRSYVAILIFAFDFNLFRVVQYVFNIRYSEELKETLFYYIMNHIEQASVYLTFILAISLLIMSLLDILFSIAMLYKKRFGAIGLFATSIAWVPIEILFISKFLLMSKTLVLLLDFLIIVFLFRIITKKGNFRSRA